MDNMNGLKGNIPTQIGNLRKLNDLYVDQAPILIDKWSLQIRNATMQASKTHKDALSIKKWERNLEILKAQIYLMKMRLSK